MCLKDTNIHSLAESLMSVFIDYDMLTTACVFYLIVVLYEGELSWLQELSLGDIQPVFTVQELDHRSVAVPHRKIILYYQTLQMLNNTSVEDR